MFLLESLSMCDEIHFTSFDTVAHQNLDLNLGIAPLSVSHEKKENTSMSDSQFLSGFSNIPLHMRVRVTMR